MSFPFSNIAIKMVQFSEKCPTGSSMNSKWIRPRTLVLALVSFFLALVFWSLPSRNTTQIPSLKSGQDTTLGDVETWCPLPEKPKYPNDGLRPSFLFADKASVERQVKRLSAAVDVPTVSYDDNGDVGKDKRWKPFYRFHEVLEDLFPLVLVFLSNLIIWNAVNHL
jgi:Gly-Xaa carboxypeptidase